jgi:eukaryotic-like serine/threonine-protein kinase
VGDLVAGRYRIHKQLGAGGFGVVFHARQESMGRDVAIKFLSPKVTQDPVAVERFRREAFNASGLRHPNTIVLHDYGQDDQERFYIVMELLEGQPLSKAIFTGGGLTLHRALHIGEQILKSLGEAHLRSLVHRDLKPENIFLTELLSEPDFVKVLDFGLSKAIEAPDPSLTQEGVVFGTPLYMAPEQAYGEDVVPASDLFAFGLLLYEMLVGERPFSGRSSMDVMLKLTQEPLPRLPAPLTDTALARYLDRLTEKEPENRFSDAVQALPTLQALLRGEQLEGLPPIDEIYVGTHLDRRTNAPPRAPVVPAGDLLGELFAPEELAASEKQVARAELIVSGGHAGIEPLADATLHNSPSSVANIRPTVTPTTGHPAARSGTRETVRPAPGKSVSVDLNARRKRSKYGYDADSDSIKTIITKVDVSGDERAKGVRSLSELVYDVPIVGRETEIVALEQRGTQAMRGLGGMLLVEGDAGIGKSALVAEFRARMEARQGVRVVHGAYHENSTGPGSGLREAVEDLLGIRGMDDDRAVRVVRNRMKELNLGRPEFVRMLMSALRPTLAMEAELKMSAARTSSPLAFRVLERLLMREADESPVILIVEDLHWADPFALGFVEYLVSSLSQAMSGDSGERLVQRKRPLPLLCVATLRRSHVLSKAALVGVIGRMGKFLGKGFGRFEVPPLDATASATLLSHILPVEPALLASIVRAGRGNALYLIQALRLLAARRILQYESGAWALRPGGSANLPQTLPQLVVDRVSHLAQDLGEAAEVAEIARLLSVLGACFSHNLAESYFVHLNRTELVGRLNATVGTLVHGGVLRRVAGKDTSYTFEHDLMQEVLVEQARLVSNAQETHVAAARAMEAIAGGSGSYAADTGFLSDVAEHWEAGGEAGRAVDARIRGARTAERGLDLESARSLYRQAEEELERSGDRSARRSAVQLSLAALYIRLGELGPAEDLLSRGIALAKELGDPRAEGRALALMGSLLTVQSRYKEALRAFRRSGSCFEKLGDNSADLAGLAEAFHGQGEVARLRGDLSSAEHLFTEALDKARFAGATDVEAHCLHGLGRISHVSGRLNSATRFLNQALERFDQCGLVIASAAVASDLGLSQLYTDGRAVAEAAVRRALDILDTAGEPLMCAHARIHMGLILRRSSDLDAADHAADEAMRVFRQLNNTYGVAKATLLKGEIAHSRGRFEEARDLGQDALQQHEAIGDAHGVALTLLYLGQWELESGDLDQAEQQLSHAIVMFEKGSILLYHPVTQLHLGRVAEERGELERAKEYYADGIKRAREAQNREVEALGAALMGGLSLIRGRLSQARGFLSTALQVANAIDDVELRVLATFGVAWVETLAGNAANRKRHLQDLHALLEAAPHRDFYLRERVSRVAKAVKVVRGAKEADWYRMTALEVLQQMGAA